MKKVTYSILFSALLMVCVQCRAIKNENYLSAPDTWRGEVLNFPLIFAKSLSYKGEEHIRFAKGWGDVDDDAYFSYVFVWILEKDPQMTIQKLETDMDTYFTGLMKMGLIIKFRFFKKLPKTFVSFREDDSRDNSFKGTISVYDAFFRKEKILLHSKVSMSYCKKIKKHFVFFRLSPKEFEHSMWKDLENVSIKFDCTTQ